VTNGTETTFAYFGPSDGAQLRWKLKTRTNRIGNTPQNRGLNPNPYTTSFAYDPAGRVTTVTAPPLSAPRVTRYAYDPDGKVTQLTDPLGQPTQVQWTSDFKVSKVTEPKGVATPTVPDDFTTTYTYNANGYLTSQRNQITTRVERTKLTHPDTPVDSGDVGNHLSLLATVTSPKGVATPTAGDFQWRYSYDIPGNPDLVTDPTNAVTDYDYSLAGSANPGMVAQVHDANGNPPTTFPSYDPSGQPTEIKDPLGNSTKLDYDPDGRVTSIQDPNHAADSGDPREFRTFFDYDSFGRLGQRPAPKSTRLERGRLLWSGADYDANDNVIRRVDPHYGSVVDDGEAAPAATASYDEMDRPLVLANSDKSVDSQGERTVLEYDEAGRLRKTTAPEGVRSTTVDDRTTVYAYDLLDRVARQTIHGASTSPSDTRITHLCYDTAGDLRSVTSPRAGLATVTCPGTGPLTGVAFTSSFDYDDAHRQVASRDPLGHETRTSYDANGNVAAQEQDIDIASGRAARTTTDYDQRDAPITLAQRLDGATNRNVVSRIEYDNNGNRSRVISPRANDAAGGSGPFTSYVTAFIYDAANRLTRTTLPFDGRDGTERQYVHRAYDAGGNLLWASLPVTTASASSVQDGARTLESYFDPGWIRSSDDPANPKVRFDYTALGQQAERTPERKDTPGILDTDKRMTWAYFDDGQLEQRTDQGGQAATYGYDADNNLTSAHNASGLTDPGEQPVDTQATYTGFDEVAKTRFRKQGAANWTFSDATYDADGNVATRRENGEETDAGTQTKAPRSYQYSYDQADRVTGQLDLGTDGACAGDQRIVNSFWATGWDKQRDSYRAGSGCAGDPTTWPKKQSTAWTQFDNGLLKTLETLARHPDGTDELTESHQVGYTDDAGVYVNGHRTSDHYLLRRAEGNTATTCVSVASACDAKYGYDARDRLISHQLRATKTNTYTYDEPARLLGDLSVRAGDLTTQVENGVTTTRKYTAQQLTEQTTGGATGKYWYDTLGNLDCVTTAAGSQADCSPSDGTTASANLVADQAYDYLNRLAGIRYFAGGPRTDKTDYTYDALDRVTREVEDHAGTAKDRTTNSFQGLSNLVTQEQQTGGTDPKTKTYAYDAYGHRLAMTTVPTAGGTPEQFTYATDVHGSVSQLLDDAGNVKASYGYSAYGGTDAPPTDAQALTTGDPDPQAPLNPYRYASRRVDSGTAPSSAPTVPAGASGYDMGARRFGPDLGAFLQQDLFYGALADLGLATDPLTKTATRWPAATPSATSSGTATRSPPTTPSPPTPSSTSGSTPPTALSIPSSAAHARASTSKSRPPAAPAAPVAASTPSARGWASTRAMSPRRRRSSRAWAGWA
jgi:YD repeat-containing protein